MRCPPSESFWLDRPRRRQAELVVMLCVSIIRDGGEASPLLESFCLNVLHGVFSINETGRHDDLVIEMKLGTGATKNVMFGGTLRCDAETVDR